VKTRNGASIITEAKSLIWYIQVFDVKILAADEECIPVVLNSVSRAVATGSHVSLFSRATVSERVLMDSTGVKRSGFGFGWSSSSLNVSNRRRSTSRFQYTSLWIKQ
jgi:hypothetical protein